ncbi:MAG: type IX secretion system membrane protein PorP/SprF [Bacteroidia bacterium]|nr:type IX secretion system membrane protein PorP/SprF [Bacteroidia bacterium]
MKKYLLFAVLLVLAWQGKSQQLPLYSQYMMNGFLLNPAIAGSKEFIPVALTVRQQWVGIKDAPQTYALSGHAAPFINKHMGIGGYIYNDKFGPVSRTGLLACYAYHLKLDSKNKLAFGVSLSGFQYKIDETNLTLTNPNDDAVPHNVQSKFVPDANFGAYFYSDRYWAGLAVAQLFQWKVDIGQSVNANKMVRHYFITSGYKFDLNNYVKNFEIEPSLLVKATEMRSPLQLDINVKGYYKKNYWLGFSYRTQDAFITLLGVKYKQYYFGYAFDYTLSNISNYVKGGSHEIMIGVNIGEGGNKGASLL